jgi:hypothetical protein
MQAMKFPGKRRLLEILCVLFGHLWDVHEETKSSECDYPLERADTCSRCGLANRDTSGFWRLFNSLRTDAKPGRPEGQQTHTVREDFEHFLSYSGLWSEEQSVKDKLFMAYEAAYPDVKLTVSPLP